MSFDVVFQRFDGEPADADAVLGQLVPIVADRNHGWARLVTSDGEADVYGMDDLSDGLMINHASGRAIWDVMFKVARDGGLVILPVGCGTFVADARLLDTLPDGVPEPVRLIGSGDDLPLAVGSA